MIKVESLAIARVASFIPFTPHLDLESYPISARIVPYLDPVNNDLQHVCSGEVHGSSRRRWTRGILRSLRPRTRGYRYCPH